MYCGRCGAENAKGSRFCGKCGAPLGEGASSTGPVPEKQHRWPVFAAVTIVLTAVIVTVVAAVATWHMMSAGGESAQGTAEETFTATESLGEEEVPIAEFSGEEASAHEISAEEETSALQQVVFGDERFEEYLPLLEGLRVGVLTNHTGMVGDDASGEHIVDALLARGVNVTAIFTPEHGFRGDRYAGEDVPDDVDPETGIPLVSLYENGRTIEPSFEGMNLVDIVVADMQDIGARFYTYYITLYYMMDACAAWAKQLVILDRPNPNGFYVDGPILREEFKSGVGQLPVPIVHGMTWGELARMINGEGWLDHGRYACDIIVIPCENYTHQTLYQLNIMPSTGLRDMRSIYLYPSLCLFENSIMSVGRGTDDPFRCFGCPYLEGASGYEYTFIPREIPGSDAVIPYQDEVCFGMDLRSKPVEEILVEKFNIGYFLDAYHAVTGLHPEVSYYGKPNREGFFVDLLFGTDAIRAMIDSGYTAEEIRSSWAGEVESFMDQRRSYLLYEE